MTNLHSITARYLADINRRTMLAKYRAEMLPGETLRAYHKRRITEKNELAFTPTITYTSEGQAVTVYKAAYAFGVYPQPTAR